MYRTRGFRVVLDRSQARRIDLMRDSQRHACNRTVSRLKEDPPLTRFDLQKKFAALWRMTPWLWVAPAKHQYAALHRARAAADLSNRYGDGSLKYRSRKRPNTDRNQPEWVVAAPDGFAGWRENQARNRPTTSSAGRHLGGYEYVTRVYPTIYSRKRGYADPKARFARCGVVERSILAKVGLMDARWLPYPFRPQGARRLAGGAAGDPVGRGLRLSGRDLRLLPVWGPNLRITKRGFYCCGKYVP